MSVTSYQNGSVAVGPTWTNPSDALVAGGSYATPTGFYDIGTVNSYVSNLQLIKAGTTQSTNRGSHSFYPVSSPIVAGGSSDLWGTAWLGSDFDDPNFGLAIGIGQFDSSAVTYTDNVSGYLYIKDFTFGLSDAVTILGIEVSLATGEVATGGGTSQPYIDGVSIRIYYTYTPKVTALGDSAGMVYSKAIHRTMPDKTFDFNVSDHAGNFLGKLPDPASDPTFKMDMNNLQSSMPLTLPINDITTLPAGIGPGQDIEVNNDVEVIAYYGQYEETVDENGEPMVDEDFNLQLGTNGAPEGDTIYSGWMSRWELDLGITDTTLTNIITHSNELFQIMLETDDVAIDYNTSWNGGTVGISGSGPGDNVAFAQVISVTSTTNYSKITVPLQAFSNVQVTMQVYYGTPGAPGAFITSAIGVRGDDLGGGFFNYIFNFGAYIALNSGDTITASYTTDISKTGGNPTYPANWKTGSSYGSTAWLNNGGGLVQQSYSSLFTLWQAGGSTNVTYSNMDPADIFMSMIDFAAARGSRIRYTATSVTRTHTLVTVPFKGSTVGDAIQIIPTLCPADWYVTFDPGTNIVSLKQRAGTPTRTVTLGQNLAALKIGKTLEGIVNQTFFTGGGNPSLYVKTTDQAARIKWRPALEKVGNINVVDAPTAKILSQNEIDRKKEPQYYGTLTIFSKSYWIEDVNLGELLAFMNHGALIDGLQLQAASIIYSPDKLDIPLQTLLPKTQQIADDTNRQVKNLAAINNPISPS